MKFSADLILEIKNRINIVDLVQRYVELRPSGRAWIGPCPFHQETKPSFSVFPDNGSFYCFGCQASGDVLEFFSRITGLDFKETVLELAREAGLKVEHARAGDGTGSKRSIFLEMHQRAQKFFQGNLSMELGSRARKYLSWRGISDDLIQLYALGWAGRSWHGLENFLLQQGFSRRDGVDSGLLSENRQGKTYDRFRARVTFPILDWRGKVIAFGGRAIDEDGGPKYLNSSDSPIYKKGEHLYGLFQARQAIGRERFVYLTEGYIDVLTMVQYGFANSVAVLGTALTLKQVRRISGLCNRVVLLFDGDQAGLKAALKSTELFLQSGLEVRVIVLPEGEDVDSLLRQDNGHKYFLQLQSKAKEGLVFCIEMINLSYSPKEIMGWARNFLTGLQDIALLSFYLPRISRGLGLNETELRQSLSAVFFSKGRSQAAVQPNKVLSSRDLELLGFTIACPDYLTELKRFPVNDLLCGEKSRALWDKIISFGPIAVQEHLTAEERKVYWAAQAMWASDVNREEAWSQLKHFLENKTKAIRRKRLFEKFVQAQRAGDPLAVDLLKQYNSLLREVE